MVAFAWRRRNTRHFGQQWVPFVDLRLSGGTGRRQHFALQIDTGAVISVLRRSAATYLGFEAESGHPIQLGSIGGHPHRYFIHTLNAELGSTCMVSLRFAIAESEDAPNLLGRLDVLDRFRIELDPSVRQTRITVLS